MLVFIIFCSGQGAGQLPDGPRVARSSVPRGGLPRGLIHGAQGMKVLAEGLLGMRWTQEPPLQGSSDAESKLLTGPLRS